MQIVELEAFQTKIVPGELFIKKCLVHVSYAFLYIDCIAHHDNLTTFVAVPPVNLKLKLESFVVVCSRNRVITIKGKTSQLLLHLLMFESPHRIVSFLAYVFLRMLVDA